jgi:acyl-CoA thioester hydrolase
MTARTARNTAPTDAQAAPDAQSGAPKRHVYLCPLRWSDMDAFQHVNNVVYLRYLEEARVDWMFNRAAEAGVPEFENFGTVVAKHEIEYKRPLVYRPEPVRVETWVTHLGVAKFTLAYEVRDDESVYATASSVLVPFNLAEGCPRRLSEMERNYLSEFLAP